MEIVEAGTGSNTVVSNAVKHSMTPDFGRGTQEQDVLSALKEKLKIGEVHTITRENVQELFGVLDTEGRGEIPKDSLQAVLP